MIMAAVVMICQPEILAQTEDLRSAAALQVIPTIVPVIINGEAQKIPTFEKPDDWIKHDLWVETEFDSDGDGKRDRMHVDVTRPLQTRLRTSGSRLFMSRVPILPELHQLTDSISGT